MKPEDIVAILKNESPDALGKVNEKRARAIVAAALRVIGQAVKNADAGALPVAGLGRFVIKEGHNKEGKATRTVTLRPPVPKKAAENTEAPAA